MIKVVVTKRSTKRMLNMKEMNKKELNMKGKKFGKIGEKRGAKKGLHMKKDQAEKYSRPKSKYKDRPRPLASVDNYPWPKTAHGGPKATVMTTQDP